MLTGKLHSVESFGAVDGPGIRTVFFMQGCPARCLYCHNPDSWKTKNAKEEMTVEEIVRIAQRGKPYYGKDGGVTFSGGEPLMQGEFLCEAIDALAAAGISSIIDTSGTYIDEYSAKAISKCQMILLDIKHSDPDCFKRITGLKQGTLMEVIDAANDADIPVWVRQVTVPGLTDSEENVLNLKRFIEKHIKNLYNAELLGYHNMAIKKWDKLGLDYKLRSTPPMDRGKLAKLNSLL